MLPRGWGSRRLATAASAAAAAAASSRALVVAELDRGVLAGATLSAITAAVDAVGQRGCVHLLLAGHQLPGQVVADAAALRGVSKVLVADRPALDRGMPEVLSSVVMACQATSQYTHLVAGSSTFGKNVMPRVAAQLDVAQVSDVLSVVSSPDVFTRPIYAGNAIATVRSTDPVKVLTVRTTAFAHAGKADTNAATTDQVPSPDEQFPGSAEWISEERVESERPELGGARVVISGGRGMKSADNFKMLEQLADKLGGALGATRAAVDAGMCSNDMQVGQTGKVVAPDLYVAVGLSGAVQHLAGMKDSKTIVAINKDPDSPIFSVADYGLVDDLFTAVPELIKTL